MEANERIDYLIRTLSGNNAKAFADRCGIPPASLSRARRGKASPAAYCQRILGAFPEVRAEWLLEGEGSPFRSDAERDGVAERLDALIGKVDRLAAMLEGLLGAGR